MAYERPRRTAQLQYAPKRPSGGPTLPSSWRGASAMPKSLFRLQSRSVHAGSRTAVWKYSEQSLEPAQRSGFTEQAGQIFVLIAGIAVELRRHGVAARYLDRGIAYCSELGLELFRFTCSPTAPGWSWTGGAGRFAADSAMSVLRIPRTSTTPRIIALVVLGLVGQAGRPGAMAPAGRGVVPGRADP